MLQGGNRFTNHLTTHCFMQCAVYTFSLHSIHSTVGHMEKEPESKTPPTPTILRTTCLVKTAAVVAHALYHREGKRVK